LQTLDRLHGNLIRRITSATGAPVSARFNPKAICASLRLDRFILSSVLMVDHEAGKTLVQPG